MLLGESALARLQHAHVAVVGLGGVGGTAAEALARSGIGRLTLADGDVVAPSNLNRQLVATGKTLNKNKAVALRDKLLDINPHLTCVAISSHITAQNLDLFLAAQYDYVIDAIDSMPDKIALIVSAKARNLQIISATGAGNRLRMGNMRIADIYQTRYDAICRILRKELKAQEIAEHQVVFCDAEPETTQVPPASMIFVPSEMGLMLAQTVVEALIKEG